MSECACVCACARECICVCACVCVLCARAYACACAFVRVLVRVCVREIEREMPRHLSPQLGEVGKAQLEEVFTVGGNERNQVRHGLGQRDETICVIRVESVQLLRPIHA